MMIAAFSRIFAKERPIKGNGSFKAYLYTTARHLALRHKQKHRLVFLRLDELDFEPQSDALADTALLHSERDRLIHKRTTEIKRERQKKKQRGLDAG